MSETLHQECDFSAFYTFFIKNLRRVADNVLQASVYQCCMPAVKAGMTKRLRRKLNCTPKVLCLTFGVQFKICPKFFYTLNTFYILINVGGF